jgi:hypothetical protein
MESEINMLLFSGTFINRAEGEMNLKQPQCRNLRDAGQLAIHPEACLS